MIGGPTWRVARKRGRKSGFSLPKIAAVIALAGAIAAPIIASSEMLRERGREGGFSLPEIATVIALAGAIAAPIIASGETLRERARARQTQLTLELAREAVIAFAVNNGGCLPFAADSEGGLPESTDTGVGVPDKRAGDLPWADLGLSDSFLDGDGLRVQYYVASVYTDDGSDPNEITCAAGHRGAEWTQWASYPGTASDPYYVYYTPSGGDRRLYRIIGTLPAGTSPDAADASTAVEVTDAFPENLLELRRGPVFKANSGGQKDVLSAQNAFVLIAPGVNRNAKLDARYIRDANHAGNGGLVSAWPAGFRNVDDVTFSANRRLDEDDNTINGDDSLMLMSFIGYKTRLADYGLHMERICETSC